MTSSILITDAKCLKTEHGNHYAIVTFTPKVMTDKGLFLFDKGRYWSNEEKVQYIRWFFSHPPNVGANVTHINLNVSLEECNALKGEDAFIDWSYVSRPFFHDVVKSYPQDFSLRGGTK